MKLFCVFLDVQSEHVNIEEDLTVLVDFEKYQQLANARRHPRNAKSFNQTTSSVCKDLEKEEYQKCGNKCVLGCRYDSLVSENVTATDNCNATKCIEGCFCKDGYVRYHHKCVPTTECPARKSKSIGLLYSGYETASNPAKIFGILQKPCGISGCRPIVQMPSKNSFSLLTNERIYFESRANV